jgi:superfamily I DNA/RNA helicase
LVVVDDENGVELPQSWRRELRRVPHHEVATSQIGVLKGLEYQHVLLILSRRLYEEANAPHQGYGQRTYDQRRLLRIPFSRAKDSLVVFAV